MSVEMVSKTPYEKRRETFATNFVRRAELLEGALRRGLPASRALSLAGWRTAAACCRVYTRYGKRAPNPVQRLRGRERSDRRRELEVSG